MGAGMQVGSEAVGWRHDNVHSLFLAGRMPAREAALAGTHCSCVKKADLLARRYPYSVRSAEQQLGDQAAEVPLWRWP